MDKEAANAADAGPVTEAEDFALSQMTFDRVLDRAIAKSQWSRRALQQAAKYRLRDIAVQNRKTLRIRSLKYWIAQQEAADIALLTLMALRNDLSRAVMVTLPSGMPTDISFGTPAESIEQLLAGHASEPMHTYERAVAEAFQVRARIHSMGRGLIDCAANASAPTTRYATLRDDCRQSCGVTESEVPERSGSRSSNTLRCLDVRSGEASELDRPCGVY